MQKIHMPQVNAAYWGGILLASVFGTNLGDYYAHRSGLYIVNGILLLAILTVPLFVMERFDRRRHLIYYWLVIVIIRTGATNIADYLQFRVHIPQSLLCAALAAMIALCAWCQQRVSDDRGSNEERATGGGPDSGVFFWLAMLGAGVFGTVLGDVSSYLFGEGLASIGLSVALALALVVWRRAAGHLVAIYWLTVAVARTAGTAIGDWLAESKLLDIGLPAATVISGIALAGLLLLQSRRPNPAAA
jgi:uncharacterized membrane-anchored protein